MRKLTEEEEERIAARWRRAKGTWRTIGRCALAILAALFLSFVYCAGELNGIRACVNRPSTTP